MEKGLKAQTEDNSIASFLCDDGCVAEEQTRGVEYLE